MHVGGKQGKRRERVREVCRRVSSPRLRLETEQRPRPSALETTWPQHPGTSLTHQAPTQPAALIQRDTQSGRIQP